MLVAQACTSASSPQPKNDPAEAEATTATVNPNLGGDTTRFETQQNSFGLPAPELSNEERRIFERGDSFFTQNWVTSPASTDARDGLGPTFNAQACASCHVFDGRGFPLEDAEGEPRLGLLIRLSVPGADPVTGGPVPDPNYGSQLQDRSVLDVPAEGTVTVTYRTIIDTYADGTTYELREPTFTINDLAFGPLDEDIQTSPRLAPQVMGVGLLEAIPEEDILANADPDDADSDGISGRAQRAWNPATQQGGELGRFGWKAEEVTVENQVAGAFAGDIGITSHLSPLQNCPSVQLSCQNAADGGNPEVTDERLGVVTFYNRTLSVPGMRDYTDESVVAGAQEFETMGCSACHVSSFTTGDDEIPVLEDQNIAPYTDLLLHDMGPGLADNRPVFEADGQEWRTPPLWGVGLIDDVNAERYLLHDGRARTFEEAILWHGGEGEASSEAFRTASEQRRAELVVFLESL